MAEYTTFDASSLLTLDGYVKKFPYRGIKMVSGDPFDAIQVETKHLVDRDAFAPAAKGAVLSQTAAMQADSQISGKTFYLVDEIPKPMGGKYHPVYEVTRRYMNVPDPFEEMTSVAATFPGFSQDLVSGEDDTFNVSDYTLSPSSVSITTSKSGDTASANHGLSAGDIVQITWLHPANSDNDNAPAGSATVINTATQVVLSVPTTTTFSVKPFVFRDPSRGARGGIPTYVIKIPRNRSVFTRTVPAWKEWDFLRTADPSQIQIQPRFQAQEYVISPTTTEGAFPTDVLKDEGTSDTNARTSPTIDEYQAWIKQRRRIVAVGTSVEHLGGNIYALKTTSVTAL